VRGKAKPSRRPEGARLRPRLDLLEDRCLLTAGLTAFDLPMPPRAPFGLTAGSDGNLWFTENWGNQIGRITPAGTLTEFPLPVRGRPVDITTGPDGNLWFTLHERPQLWSLTPTGVFTAFDLPAGSVPSDLTAGPDGNLWFTVSRSGRIGRMTPDGAVTEFPLPGTSLAFTITAGPDGNVWFASTNASHYHIGRITPAGDVLEFPVPGPGPGVALVAAPGGLTAGPDGNLWLTALGDNKIRRLTPAGVFTEFPLPSGQSAFSITTGPDGNLWFAEGAGRLGRITPAGVITEFTLPGGNAFANLTTGPDGNLWFTTVFPDQIGRLDLDTFLALDGTPGDSSPEPPSTLGGFGGGSLPNPERPVTPPSDPSDLTDGSTVSSVTITPGQNGFFTITVSVLQADGSTRQEQSFVSGFDLIRSGILGRVAAPENYSLFVTTPVYGNLQHPPADPTRQVVWSGLPSQRVPARTHDAPGAEPSSRSRPATTLKQGLSVSVLTGAVPADQDAAEFLSVAAGAAPPLPPDRPTADSERAPRPGAGDTRAAGLGSPPRFRSDPAAALRTRPPHLYPASHAGRPSLATIGRSGYLALLFDEEDGEAADAEVAADEYFARLALLEEAGRWTRPAVAPEQREDASSAPGLLAKVPRPLSRLAIAWLLLQSTYQVIWQRRPEENRET
jgi:streptogramin lyase